MAPPNTSATDAAVQQAAHLALEVRARLLHTGGAPGLDADAEGADEEGVEIFYFSSFDEAWKVDKEGDVGAYWGLWDEEGNLKYV